MILNKKTVINEPVSLKIPLIFAAIILAAGVLFPLTELALAAVKDNSGNFVGIANFVAFFKTQSLAFTLWYSIATATTTALITVVAGFVYAFALKRSKIPGRKIFRLIALLPLFAPSLMHGISLMYLLGNKGLITALLVSINPSWRIPLYGFNGIVIAQSVYVFPQMVLMFLVALDNCDGRLYEAATMLGANSVRRFFTITVPAVKGTLLSGILIAFTLAFTDFGAAKIVGGQYTVLSVEIYKRVIGQMDFAMGSVVSLLLMLPAVAAFMITLLHDRGGNITSNAKPLTVKTKTSRDIPLFIAVLLMASGILLIMGTVVFASLVTYWPYNLAPTLAHFNFGQKSVTGFAPFLNSIIMSALTALIGVVIVFVAAYTSERMKAMTVLRRSISFLATMPVALPGLVIGLSYILFFNRPMLTIPLIGMTFSNPFMSLYGTIWLLVLANIIHFIPVCFTTARTTLKNCDREFEVLSAALGVHPMHLIRRVILPITLPAMIEVALYLFVNAMITVSALIFIIPAAFKVASVAVIDMDDAGDTAEAAAMSVMIVAVNLAAQGAAILLRSVLKSSDTSASAELKQKESQE